MKVHASLHEPSLLTEAISTEISCTDQFYLFRVITEAIITEILWTDPFTCCFR